MRELIKESNKIFKNYLSINLSLIFILTTTSTICLFIMAVSNLWIGIFFVSVFFFPLFLGVLNIGLKETLNRESSLSDLYFVYRNWRVAKFLFIASGIRNFIKYIITYLLVFFITTSIMISILVYSQINLNTVVNSNYIAELTSETIANNSYLIIVSQTFALLIASIIFLKNFSKLITFTFHCIKNANNPQASLFVKDKLYKNTVAKVSNYYLWKMFGIAGLYLVFNIILFYAPILENKLILKFIGGYLPLGVILAAFIIKYIIANATIYKEVLEFIEEQTEIVKDLEDEQFLNWELSSSAIEEALDYCSSTAKLEDFQIITIGLQQIKNINVEIKLIESENSDANTRKEQIESKMLELEKIQVFLKGAVYLILKDKEKNENKD